MARRFFLVLTNRNYEPVREFLDSPAFIQGQSFTHFPGSPAGLQITVESAFPPDEDGTESTHEHHQPNMTLRGHPFSRFTQEPWSGNRTQVLTAEVPAGTVLLQQHNYLYELGEAATGTNPSSININITGTTVTATITFTGNNQTFRACTLLLEDPTSFTPDIPDLSPITHTTWSFPATDYRAFTNARVIPRHPSMPSGNTGLKATRGHGAFEEVTVKRFGDYLIFDDGSTPGPFVAYWRRHPATSDYVPAVNQSAFLAAKANNPAVPPNWSGLEPKVTLRSMVVKPDLRVLAGWESSVTAKDYTPFVTKISRSSVTITGPAAALEGDTGSDRLPRFVFITTTGGVPISSGMLVKNTVVPYANGRELTYQLLPFTRFHDIDLSMRGEGSFSLPSFEDEFVEDLLHRAGYPSHRDLLVEPGLQFRNASLWTQPAPDGPGFSPQETINTYWSVSGSSSTNEIQTVLQANMLELHDAPDGSVFITSIIPKPSLTLLQLISAAGTIKVGFTLSGNTPSFHLDTRLNISSIDMDLSESFAEIEVEGTSNSVEVEVAKADATFVQGANSSEWKQERFIEASAPGNWQTVNWPTESNTNLPGPASFNSKPFGDKPWVFGVMDGNDPLFEVYPVRWMNYRGAPTHKDAVVAKKVDTGSSSRRLTGRGFKITKLSNFTQPMMEHPEGSSIMVPWFQWFLARYASVVAPGEDPLTGNDDVAYGIWAQSTGKTFLGSTWEFRTEIVKPDSATMRVMPLLAKKNTERFAPKWFPEEAFDAELQLLTDLKPRKAKTIQNRFITEVGQDNAVQKYVNTGTFDYYDDNQALAVGEQLATWLTLREVLKTRRVTFQFAGTQSWWPGRFLAVARRPKDFTPHDGVTYRPTKIDIFLVESMGSVEAQVGSECWTTVETSFVGTVHHTYNASGNLTGRTVTHHMPSTWGSVYGDD